MKDNAYRLAGLKYQLKEKRDNNIKRVIWKLTDEQKEYIERLGYGVVPFIFEIRTKTFPALSKSASSIIKDVHWSSINGKRKIYRKLKVNDLKKLDDYEVYYRVFKYSIILR